MALTSKQQADLDAALDKFNKDAGWFGKKLGASDIPEPLLAPFVEGRVCDLARAGCMSKDAFLRWSELSPEAGVVLTNPYIQAYFMDAAKKDSKHARKEMDEFLERLKQLSKDELAELHKILGGSTTLVGDQAKALEEKLGIKIPPEVIEATNKEQRDKPPVEQKEPDDYMKKAVNFMNMFQQATGTLKDIAALPETARTGIQNAKELAGDLVTAGGNATNFYNAATGRGVAPTRTV